MSIDQGNVENWKAWIGKTEIRRDVITTWPVQGMSAAFDLPDPNLSIGAELPLGWHWLYFLEAKRASELGPDGHPKRGGFLPPIPLPRRMWAGGRIDFKRALRLGEAVRKESEILSVEPKSGRTGDMVFVVVRHTVYGSDEIAVVEEQDIVYREAAKPGAAQAIGKPATIAPKWQQHVMADSTLLFRFSALTFNGHKIHYDLPYATGTEYYSNLVVHGPMQAMLLLGLCSCSVESRISKFNYRGVAPLFHPGLFSVNAAESGANNMELWTADDKGNQCMTASAELQAV